MNLHEYYNSIYRLRFVQRYSNLPRVRNEDVAQHTFFVAAIVLKLHDIYEFNLEKALIAALSHDITESDLGDITHGIKKSHPELNRAVVSAERYEIQKYPHVIQEGVRVFEGSSNESLVVQLADIVQVMQYAETEMSLGNQAMSNIASEARERAHVLKEVLNGCKRDVESEE